MAFFSFGNLAIDDLVFADGTTLWQIAGGAAMYSALGMAVWTGTATAVAPVSPDYPFETLPGIEFACKRTSKRTMRNWGLYEEDGSRQFVSRRSSESWADASPNVADLGEGPYTNCHIGAMPWDRASDLVDALRKRGARAISFDVHDRKHGLLTLDQYVDLVCRVDIFLPSTQDVAELCPGLSPVDALRVLRGRLPNVAVLGVKCGGDGALVHGLGDALVSSVPSASDGLVVDVTGAGDAFCGGMLAGFAATGNAREGALHGAVSAAYAISASGPGGLIAVDTAAARERMTALRERITTMPLAAP
jgi:sugar/nucleoside kinase (ribokinase family)